MIPDSSNSSLRSLSRTGWVSMPSRSSRSSVSVNRAPRGTASLRPEASSDSDTAALLRPQRDVEPLDVEGEADSRQRPAEVTEQIVVAPAAAHGHPVGRVVDLEDGAGVVAEAVDQPEVEDDPLRGARAEQAEQRAHTRPGLLQRPIQAIEHVRTAAHARHAEQQLGIAVTEG